MRRLWTLTLVLALLIVGCSKEKKKEEGSKGAPPVSLSGKVNAHGTKELEKSLTSIDVELDDFYFAPTFIKAKGNVTLTLHLKNEGNASHTFTSQQLGQDEQLSPSDKRDINVSLPASGTIEFRCRFHEGQGMRGAFVIS